MWFWIILGVLVLGLAYIRLAPVSPDRWHNEVITERDVGDFPATGRFHAVRNVDGDVFERIVQVGQSWPRTELIAGSLDEGRVTFQTRTRLIGFPDFTTLHYDGGRLSLYARLRFGRDDFGVNKARVLAWLSAAGIE